MNTQELIALRERDEIIVGLRAELEDLTGALLDTRKDRDTSEKEVKELKATIEEIRKELIQMMEYIRGR